jgi:hypothetical protein
MFHHPGFSVGADPAYRNRMTYKSPFDMLYDPTNGTKSRCDVGRCGGNLQTPEMLGG